MPKSPSPFPTFDELRAEWGRNLATRRLQMGWTQRFLAQLVDVDQALLSRWERGLAIPSDENKVRLAGAFGEFVDVLFPWPKVRPPLPTPRPPRVMSPNGRRRPVAPVPPSGPQARRAA